MLKTRKIFTMLTMVAFVFLLMQFTGCKKDDVQPNKTDYNLMVKDVLGVTGTATFIETNSTTTTIEIMLFGAPSGSHPAELCMNSAVEGGDVIVTLNPVEGNGSSSTKVTTISYAQMNAYDGFIKVMKSSSEPDVILAMGDIGGNVITTTNITYSLDTIGAFGVSGNVLFQERVNGNTLVTITLAGAIAGQSYPATINLGSVASIGGGPVVKMLSDVNGTTGKSFTNIRKLDSGINIAYNNWLVYDGYINIYQTVAALDHIICHGDIGSN
jgi:hypothetical protein